MLGAILIGVLVLCGGCLGLVGLGLMADTADEPESSVRASESVTPTESTAEATPSTTSSQTDRDQPRSEEYWDTPREIPEGKAFEHDGFKIDDGWRLGRKSYGSPTITGLHVTTLHGDRRRALLDFTFYRGTEVLAEVTCRSRQMQENESSSMDCSSLDDFPEGWDTVKVADAW